MCGIAGVISLSGAPLRTDALKPMVDVVAHRGPDDAGYLLWEPGGADAGPAGRSQALADPQFHHISPHLPVIDSEEGRRLLAEGKWSLFLGHRRLSIIDLSPRGHQPMANRHGNVWVSYNGEVYNFRELRAELEGLGHTFASRSDTEVILHAYQQWGIACLERFNGMFAFALWDAARRRLYLARDRCGIKPLYYTVVDGAVVFGSEIKSILAYLEGRPGVDLLALNEYFSFQNTFSDRTLFEGIRLLPPGHYMTVDAASGTTGRTRYWDFQFRDDLDEPEEEIQRRLASLIKEAVVRQCVSDVPIGSYLSGGMDSGTITALTARRFGRIFTFTGGFDLSEAAEHEMTFDERELAEKMANIFQTEHYECVLHSGDMEAVMDKVIWHLEDLRVGQCYPNYYVSRLASRFVKVVMSGCGGDELFGGYPWRYATAVSSGHERYIQNYYHYWKRLVRNRDKPRLFNSDVVARLRGLRDGDDAVPFQSHTLTTFKRVFGDEVRARTPAEQVRWSLYFECKTFLHGLLVVEDKLSMAHGLETRVPLLDNEVVDFACRVPVTLKVDGLDRLERIDENLPRKKYLYQEKIKSGKKVLRKAMGHLLPPEITRARKQGFSAPDESWFRGRSAQHLRDVLLDPSARLGEYLDPALVRESLDLHAGGRKNLRLLIWSLICFETWLHTFS